jgi:hypothetical protein
LVPNVFINLRGLHDSEHFNNQYNDIQDINIQHRNTQHH